MTDFMLARRLHHSRSHSRLELQRHSDCSVAHHRPSSCSVLESFHGLVWYGHSSHVIGTTSCWCSAAVGGYEMNNFASLSNLYTRCQQKHTYTDSLSNVALSALTLLLEYHAPRTFQGSWNTQLRGPSSMKLRVPVADSMAM
jgi:hypothetical protein